jgi:LysR family transcriptional regulator, chromosome initiation inhibitor
MQQGIRPLLAFSCLTSKPMQYDPFALECLAAIVEEGGFERAAERLAITQSAVSQRLRALEAQVGTVLVVRSRPVAPTPAGAVLIRHAKQLRLLAADVDHDLRDLTGESAHGRGDERLSIAINADSIATWALPALTPIIQDGLPLEIITDDQDFTHDWLRSGEVLGCITSLKEPLRGCRVTPLGTMNYVCVGSVATYEQHKALSPANFRQMSFMTFNRKDDMQSDFVAHALGLKQVRLRQVSVPSSEGQVRAVLANWGVSVLPELLVKPHLATGDLVDMANGIRLGVQLYWHCWNLESARLAAITEALIARATTDLIAA